MGVVRMVTGTNKPKPALILHKAGASGLDDLAATFQNLKKTELFSPTSTHPRTGEKNAK